MFTTACPKLANNAPPLPPVLYCKRLSVRVTGLLVKIAPPLWLTSVWLFWMVLPSSHRLPWLTMAPPSLAPLLAFSRVRCCKWRLASSATLNSRVAPPPERMIVPPAPEMVKSSVTVGSGLLTSMTQMTIPQEGCRLKVIVSVPDWPAGQPPAGLSVLAAVTASRRVHLGPPEESARLVTVMMPAGAACVVGAAPGPPPVSASHKHSVPPARRSSVCQERCGMPHLLEAIPRAIRSCQYRSNSAKFIPIGRPGPAPRAISHFDSWSGTRALSTRMYG